MNKDLSNAHEKFLLDQVENHTHALTITLMSDNQLESQVNRRIRFEETLRHLLNRINRAIFNHRHKQKNYGIGVVTVVESGHKLNRLHAHMSLACPSSLEFSRFEFLVHKAVSKCRSLGREHELKPLSNSAGWATYMAKDGLEALLPQCTQHAKH